MSRSHPTRRRRPVLVAFTAVAAAAASVVVAVPANAASSTGGGAITVHPGQSIQAALDAAPDHATVLLAPGDYVENLTITRPVTLRGLGNATLHPSATIAENLCTEDQDGSPDGAPNNTGICILGEFGPMPDDSDIPPLVAPVTDVTIENLRITEFHGQGVLAYGTADLTVRRVEVDHVGDTGVFLEAGTGTRLLNSNVHDTGHFAVRIADSTDSVVDGNSVHGATLGIAELESTGGRITGNRVFDNCLGIALVDTGAPGSTGDVVVSGNSATGNNRYCAGSPGQDPSVSGVGLALIGAADVTVTGNRILRNVTAVDPATGEPPMIGGAGLLIADADGFGGAAATGNRITGNVILGNAPLDLVSAAAGGNTIERNVCSNSSSPGFCR